jgi:putative pyruvate formate lyase activating enzyme
MSSDRENSQGNGSSFRANDLLDIGNCTCCPRECKADRTSDKIGWCKSGDGIMISSICAHRGEEPVLSGRCGICNIFFAHCNMQCIYCQNYQISRNHTSGHGLTRLEDVVSEVESILAAGARGVGFVSPSHSIPQMLEIMAALNGSYQTSRKHDWRLLA